MSSRLVPTSWHQAAALGLPALPVSPSGSSEELSLADVWRIMLKRRTFILLCAGAVFVLALVYSLSSTPQYDSLSRIAISFDNGEVFGADNPLASLTGSDAQTKLETQVRILSSDTLAIAVVRQLHLDSDSVFTGKQAGQAPLDIRRQRALLATFRSGLTVTVVPKTELIEIRYRSRSPQLSANIVNSLVNAYIERNFKVKYESTMQASDWLQKQLDELKGNVQRTQEKLVQFQQEHGVLFSGAGNDESKNSTVSKLDDLNRQLTVAQTERIMKEAAWRMAESGNPELVGAPVPGTPLQVLHTQQAELRNQYAQVSAKYGTAYPKVAQLKAQLEQVQASIEREVNNTSERLKNEYLGAKRAEQMLSAEADKQKKEAYRLNEGAIQYTMVRREFDSSRDLYDGLLKKLKEAGITAGLRSTNVTVVDPAAVADEASEPRLLRNLALGWGMGLFLGVMVAFVRENLDNTLRTTEEIEFCSGLPSLGIIPMIKPSNNGHGKLRGALTSARAEAVELVALSHPKSHISESFRSLRSSVLLSSVDVPIKTMVVTSSIPGEGKSTTSINSAIVLAQKNSRVLLVDADLRRPRLHTCFNVANESGLSTVVMGSDKFEDAVVSCAQIPNLSLLPAGPGVPYPAELLASRRMSELLAKWREQFEYVILDAPPVLTVTDAVVLASQVDTAILVLRWGKTGSQALRRSRDLLVRAQARIAGVVVNAVDLDSPDHRYYYRGSNFSKGYYENGPTS